MVIMGCDFHPRFQQIAYVDQESGDYGERRLSHPEQAGPVLSLQIGMEDFDPKGSNPRPRSH
jgi:hypothetical protein